MTTPNNFPPSPIPQFSITGATQTGAGDAGTAAALVGRGEDAIKQLLITTEIQGSAAWNAAAAAV